jgi:hypothetical protein
MNINLYILNILGVLFNFNNIFINFVDHVHTTQITYRWYFKRIYFIYLSMILDTYNVVIIFRHIFWGKYLL